VKTVEMSHLAKDVSRGISTCEVPVFLTWMEKQFISTQAETGFGLEICFSNHTIDLTA